jgi:Sigma-70, region 4/Bacterial RNA polymerase, alpha chain C terminal domain
VAENSSTEHPSKLLGTVGRFLRIFENAGMDPQVSMQIFINDKNKREKVLDLLSRRDESTGISERINQIALHRFLFKVFGWREGSRLSSSDAEVFNYYFRSQEAFHELLDGLNPKVAEIMWLHYGLSDNKPMNTLEIANSFGISKARVRRIISGALVRMRNNEASRVLTRDTLINGETPIDLLRLTLGVDDKLRKAGITSIEQLETYSEEDLRNLPGFGVITVDNIKTSLFLQGKRLKVERSNQ